MREDHMLKYKFLSISQQFTFQNATEQERVELDE